ncbi:MAG: hypothetical protein AB1898_23280 [Acidobacteriota bacterium]
MITGFNTDVKNGDTVYHVQTEDKGTSNPLIESLIYVKGAILDTHRSSYQAFLVSPQFSESRLQKILEFQHRQIVSLIRAGRFQKGMSLQAFVDGDFVFPLSMESKAEPPKESGPAKPVAASQTPVPPAVTDVKAAGGLGKPAQPIKDRKALDEPKPQPGPRQSVTVSPTTSERPKPPQVAASSETKAQSRQRVEPDPQIAKPEQRAKPAPPPASHVPPVAETTTATAGGGEFEFAVDVKDAASLANQEGVEICVQGSRDFVGGSHVDLQIGVRTRQGRIRLENVQIVIKVIGTTFSPRLYTGKTDARGELRINFNLPTYTVGSAALIIQANTPIGADEIKYLIRKK